MNSRPGYRSRGVPVTSSLLLGLLLLVSLVAAASSHPASAYVPKAGDAFSYSETITVNNGAGEYQGYTDQTVVSGMEQMDAVNGSIVSASYNYTLQYSSSQGSSSSGGSGGQFTWSLDNYTYVSGTDDQVGYTPPVYVWFAMNPQTPVGGTFFVLNTEVTVLSQNYSLQLPTEGGKYVQTIEAQGTGSYQRNDSYGVFTASYTWTEYFDPATGYIVGYHYVESDNGQYQGQSGSFTYTDDLYVTNTSYPLTAASGPASLTTTTTASSTTQTVPGIPASYVTDLVLVAVVIVILALLVSIAAMSRRRKRAGKLPQHSQAPPGPPPAAGPAPWQSGVDLGSKPPEQVVIKEVAMVKCKYCGTLIPTTSSTCPYCGAPSPTG